MLKADSYVICVDAVDSPFVRGNIYQVGGEKIGGNVRIKDFAGYWHQYRFKPVVDTNATGPTKDAVLAAFNAAKTDEVKETLRTLWPDAVPPRPKMPKMIRLGDAPAGAVLRISKSDRPFRVFKNSKTDARFWQFLDEADKGMLHESATDTARLARYYFLCDTKGEIVYE